jgi:RNA polymerase sigma factor (sigma-70 family)
MANGYRGIACRQLDTLFNEGTVVDLTDAQLLEPFTSCRNGSAELAFEALVHRHGPMVFRVWRTILRDSHDAGDAFQATFLVLIKKARSLWLRESLGPWLHQVAHRTATRSRSAVARQRRHERLAASSAFGLADRSALPRTIPASSTSRPASQPYLPEQPVRWIGRPVRVRDPEEFDDSHLSIAHGRSPRKPKRSPHVEPRDRLTRGPSDRSPRRCTGRSSMR